jgi:hypothetical protein
MHKSSTNAIIKQVRRGEEHKNYKINRIWPCNCRGIPVYPHGDASLKQTSGTGSKLTHFDASVDPRSTTILQVLHWKGMMLAGFSVVDSYISPEPFFSIKMWGYVKIQKLD